MTNTIQVPLETLMRWEGELDQIAGAWHISDEIVKLLAQPAAPADGEAVDAPDITTKHGYPAYSVTQHQRMMATQRQRADDLWDAHESNLLAEIAQRDAKAAELELRVAELERELEVLKCQS